MRDVGVIIAAGGSGRRMGGTLPKQFLRLGQETILERTIAVFERVPDVCEIVIVTPRQYLDRVVRLVRKANVSRQCTIVAGGRERQHSVWNGLRAFYTSPSIVLVHDAVRPFVRPATIRAVISAVRTHGAAVVGVPVGDTVKLAGTKGFYARTLPRERVWAVQTPQGFRLELLVRAHERARQDRFLGTDEGSLVERLGHRVRIVTGETDNVKITTRRDLKLAKLRVDCRV
jgi:2-C-methyl-D-erythritol 4-phosphate cytidylyltransferase